MSREVKTLKLRELSLEDREEIKNKIFTMFYEQGISTGEIAKTLNIASRSVVSIKNNNLYPYKKREKMVYFTPNKGDKFGLWEFIEEVKYNGRTKMYWRCRCECGTIRDVRWIEARVGRSKSCGCTKAEENRRRMWKGVGELSGDFFCRNRNNARKRNLEFSITIEYLWQLFLEQDRKCALTGDLLKITKPNRTASLDRIDNNKGYVDGNLRWIRKDVNEMRMKRTDKELLGLCQKIINYKNSNDCAESFNKWTSNL